MDQNNLFENLNKKILFKLKPSKLHGVGLHAIQDIDQNTIIIPNSTPIVGKHYDHHELKNLNSDIIELCKNYYEPQQKDKIFVPNEPSSLLNYFYPKYFINHSKNPNSFNLNGNIISTKKIKKNEEITVNYHSHYPQMYKKMKSKKKKKNFIFKTKKTLKKKIDS